MKIAIIDPVGIKAGMNCYDLGLLNAFEGMDIHTACYSNFRDSAYKNIEQFNYFFDTKKSAWANTFNFVMAHFKSLVRCRRQKVDWVILHVFSTTAKDYLSFLVTKLFKRRIIAIIHDINSLSNEDNDLFKSRIYNMASLLVVHNQTSKKEIESLLDEKNRAKLQVIKHGNYVPFITAKTQSGLFENELTINVKYKYILFFGQIKRVKGLDILLNAVHFLPDNFKIIIAGRPHKDDFDYYQHIIDKLKIDNKIIKLIRFITDDERDFLFKTCNALVLPYRKIFQSGVLLTAMSYGLPVIASDLPANKEIISNGYNGLLFKDGDAADLADKIKKLFSSISLQDIGKNGFKTADEAYSWPVIAKQYVSTIINK